MKFGIGQSVRRVEDERLLTGGGRYTSDLAPRGCLEAYVLRSAHAHARFRFIDLETARAMPGVRLILTHAEVADLGPLPCLGVVKQVDDTPIDVPAYHVLPKDEVRHVGEALAFIVADSVAEARDAAEAIGIDWEVLPAVADMAAAMEKGAPAVWPGRKNNVAFTAEVGDRAKTEAAFARAARVVKLDISNNRVMANYLETRAALAEYDRRKDRITLTLGSQGVHSIRDSLAEHILKIPREKIRVVTQDVGGGFGTKIFMYREYPLTAVAARMLARPVRWVADRSEHFLADTHGRANLTTAELALDAGGRFLAMRVDLKADMGAYLSQFAPYIPWIGSTMTPGVYDIRAVHVTVRGIFTNTTPIDAYRGAGRPEAAYVIERLVDHAAREIGMAPDRLRLKNYIKPRQMPYRTATGRTYDTGEFAGHLGRVKELGDWAGFKARLRASKKAGKLRGIGLASYVEIAAGGSPEAATVRIEEDGSATVLIGTQSNGQGHATAYAQVASQHLDLPPEKIRVVQGDTDLIATGGGTGGSRSIPVGGAAVSRAATTLVEKLKLLASDALETGAGDLEIADGKVRVAGTDKAIGFSEIARLPAAKPEMLSANESWRPVEGTYPNGTHLCEVEIDPETGVTDIVRYAIVDDFGVTLNPVLLAGQVHGGVVQGIGQALMEEIVFDEDGQLVSGSLTDYALPRADQVPDILFETRNVPSTSNLLGLKGAGEAGSIGSCPAIMNAIVDALHREAGVRHIDMPATPPRVRAALAAARG
jgi:carbon-monoxide dehydrogenase large subunit